jgi:hypothetical protein
MDWTVTFAVFMLFAGSGLVALLTYLFTSRS